MPTTTFHPAQLKFLQRILSRLYIQPQISGYRLLRQDGSTILADGQTGSLSVEHSFAEFILHLDGSTGLDTPPVERQIKSLRKLANIVLRGLSDQNGMKASFFIDSYLEVLLLLEERINLLNFYERILHLNKSILMADDLFGVLQIIMDTACRACNGEGSSLLLVDQKTGEMYFNVVSGENENVLKEIRIPAGKGIAGSVVNSARPEIIPDVAADSRSFQHVDQVLQHQTRNMIIAPILAGGVVIGVLEVINSKRSTGFLSEDLDFLINIASHTSLFIENIKAKDALVQSNRNLDRKNSEIHALYEIGQIVNSSLDPEVLKQKLLQTLLEVMPVSEALILSPGNRSLVAEYHCLQNGRPTPLRASEHKLAGATDILLWMHNYQEPFAFFETVEKSSNIAQRFLEQNADFYKQYPVPELWVPIFKENKEIEFILSLNGGQFRRQIPVNDLKFFKSVMGVCYSAFRNVNSFRDAVESRKREEDLRRAFQKYVPSRIAADLVENENPVPAQRIVSVLFADIRNFTHLSETLPPMELVALINQHFEDMVDAVALHGGVVDKFMGDSLMAVFGMTESGPTDAANALKAAAEMQKRLSTRALQNQSLGKLELQMGIGLASGPVITGNIGSHTRMDYTIIGETVNIASRLEKAVKHYGVHTLFTEETHKQAPQQPCREVDLLQVRGSERPARVYEPLTLSRSGLGLQDYEQNWPLALQAYRKREFETARLAFKELYEKSKGQDQVSSLYMERCEHFQQNPPAENWQAIHRLEN
ncbi:MAG: GAF domain-containing protein [Leptospiraceae bacterium]|nr:GAF domain-containing protein [Leptospiraceae bacterium]